MKTCIVCHVTKNEEDFVLNTRNGVPKRRNTCKSCKNAKAAATRTEVRADQTRAWRQNNPEAYLRSKRRTDWKRYGMDPDVAEAYYREHDGKCEICGATEEGRALCMDHCHETGRVRGMLCHSCNRALGLLKDSPNLLQQAYNYLTR